MQPARFAFLLVLLAQVNVHSTADQPRRVKCDYYEAEPLRTYCLILGWTGPITGDAAQRACDNIGMAVLSSDTPLDRVCSFSKLFSLKEYTTWMSYGTNNVRPTSHICDFGDGGSKQTYKKGGGNVVCEAEYYHSQTSNCITVMEKSEEFEYCYTKGKNVPSDLRSGCRAMGMSLGDISQWNGTDTLKGIRSLVRTDLEFWVNLKKEDISELSGVIAFNAKYHNWDTSCVTVWFGRAVPWFFKRNCNELFPVICQNFQAVNSHSSGLGNDCVHMSSSPKLLNYCVTKSKTFDFDTSLEFCRKGSMAVLSGTSLRDLVFDNTSIFEQHRNNIDELLWDTNYNTGYSRMCAALNLTDKWVRRVNRPCSDPLGYMCTASIRRRCRHSLETPEFHAGQIQNVQATDPEFCFSQNKLTFEESVKFCEEHGMILFPERRLFGDDFQTKRLAKEILDTPGVSDTWAQPYRRDGYPCVVLFQSTLHVTDNCLQKHPAVCTRPLAHCYETGIFFVSSGSHYVSVSAGLRDIWEIAIHSKDIEEILGKLDNVATEVLIRSDIESMPQYLANVLVNFKGHLRSITDQTRRSTYTKRLAGSLAEIVEKTILKTKLIKQMNKYDRRATISCLIHLIEDFGIQYNVR